ncbi:cyclohexanecarboxylate-CoA ligase [Parafrankia irregularis]|uniref:Cyclohexanecarboxylate-CoA ligase n=1 Tax=Parafrankia irregularis TaxID=795642 RepID=A0A0S4QLS9_9ACTN|nr:AMP-binding protein [Parafrankia sp. CH37]CUU56519.1 cyclohexanecarboxylate-CoA ligase [Parafrankia irregularis]
MEIPTVSDRYDRPAVDHYYASGRWGKETLGQILARQAGERGDKTFITDGDASMTYRQVYEAALRLAVGLKTRGVRAGDRVAVQLPNWAEFAVAAAAVARVGAVMVPIMPIYRRDEVGHVLDDADVRAVVTPATFKGFDHLGMFRSLAADRPALHSILVARDDAAVRASGAHAGGPGAEVLSLSAVSADIEPSLAEVTLGSPVGPDDPFVIVYTSGTTARPKGCLHTFNTYASGARALGTAFGYTEDDVQFGPSPITHTTGLVTSVLLPLLHGGATHVMPEWDPVRGLAEIARYRCSVAVAATTFLQMALEAYDPDRHDASSLRVWVCAGAPIPRSLVERARALLPDTRILSLYGRSENLTTTTCTVGDDPERALTSDGAALPFSQVQIVDEAGEPVPAGTEGDIAYKGPTHMLGYLGRPEDTAALFTPHGFSRSGDLGVMDADGFVRVTGRTKDIIIRGGMNISVREIEDLLAAHQAVRAVAVVGMPDERLGERACCYVVPADPADPPTLPELKEYLQNRGIALQKTPERLELLDAMPMTATGKIQKHVLRQEIAQRIERTEIPART